MAAPALPDPNPPPRPEEEAGGRMSFFEHLVDLRKRLVNSLLGIGIGMVAGLAVSPYFIDYIVKPMQAALRAHQMDDKLYYTSPAGYVGLIITLGLYLGIVIAMPWVLYQIWQFVAPGLYKHERSAVAGRCFCSWLESLSAISSFCPRCWAF
jgi:sec-independent protein translocase protein TatC